MAAERLLPPQREAGDLVAAWAGKTAGRATTATTPLRWWALVVFVTMSAVQNAVWISFSVLIPEACAFFRVSTGTFFSFMNSRSSASFLVIFSSSRPQDIRMVLSKISVKYAKISQNMPQIWSIFPKFQSEFSTPRCR